jgi:hypothetical protein
MDSSLQNALAVSSCCHAQASTQEDECGGTSKDCCSSESSLGKVEGVTERKSLGPTGVELAVCGARDFVWPPQRLSELRNWRISRTLRADSRRFSCSPSTALCSEAHVEIGVESCQGNARRLGINPRGGGSQINAVSAEDTASGREHPAALRGDYQTKQEPLIFWRTASARTLHFSAGNGGIGLLHRTWRSQGGSGRG